MLTDVLLIVYIYQSKSSFCLHFEISNYARIFISMYQILVMIPFLQIHDYFSDAGYVIFRGTQIDSVSLTSDFIERFVSFYRYYTVSVF